MSTSKNAWEQVNLAASIADLKDNHYQSLLALSAMLELLIDKACSPEKKSPRRPPSLTRS